MPLHLVEGLDMWHQEVGNADVILVLGSYGWKKNKFNLSRGYGHEAVTQFPLFSDDLYNYFKFCRKPMKNAPPSRYGVAIPDAADYGSGTKIGLLQSRIDDGGDIDINLLKYSINLLCFHADKYYRIAVEYPCKAIHGANEDEMYGVLNRVPEHVVFYRASPPQKEVDYAAIGQSYAMGIKYERGGGNSNFHRR